MDSVKRMLLSNKAWSRERTSVNPAYFIDLAKDQHPEFLWIGCSDSRVPAEEVTGTSPGELFVHRNIANLVVHTDLNLLSVLQYAVEHLEVPHIIVCGHYGCGGIAAALTPNRFGLLNKWLRHIKDTYRLHRAELDLYDDHRKRWDRMVELNVLEQVQNLVKTSIVQDAWRKRKAPTIHGWVFGLDDGILHDLVRLQPGAPIDEIYRFKFDE
jgi:carbonic anhydrase